VERRNKKFLVYCIAFLVIGLIIVIAFSLFYNYNKKKNSVNDESLKTEKKIGELQVKLEELKKQEKNETNSAEKKKLEVEINNLKQQIANIQRDQSETPPSETPPSETPPSETPPSETPPSETPPSETPNEISEEEAKDKLFKVFESLLPSDLKGNSLFTKENFVKMVEGSSLKLNFSGKKLNSLAELDSEIKECLEKNKADKIFSSLPSQNQFKANFLLIKILRSFFFYILFSPRKSDGIID
jgi:cell division protein FtsB